MSVIHIVCYPRRLGITKYRCCEETISHLYFLPGRKDSIKLLENETLETNFTKQINVTFSLYVNKKKHGVNIIRCFELGQETVADSFSVYSGVFQFSNKILNIQIRKYPNFYLFIYLWPPYTISIIISHCILLGAK